MAGGAGAWYTLCGRGKRESKARFCACIPMESEEAVSCRRRRNCRLARWKVLILRDLMPGTKRFGELKKSIGSVSQKVLTAQLRDMEESGLLTRTVYAEVPPRVEYRLTDLGRSLEPILDAMRNWGEAYKAQSG